MKKLLCILLTLAMAAGAFAVGASALTQEQKAEMKEIDQRLKDEFYPLTQCNMGYFYIATPLLDAGREYSMLDGKTWDDLDYLEYEMYLKQPDIVINESIQSTWMESGIYEEKMRDYCEAWAAHYDEVSQALADYFRPEVIAYMHEAEQSYMCEYELKRAVEKGQVTQTQVNDLLTAIATRFPLNQLLTQEWISNWSDSHWGDLTAYYNATNAFARAALNALLNPADKTALNETIAEAGTKANDTQYTEASRNALQTALSNAQTVAANLYATQQEIDNAATSLSSAIAALQQKPQPAPPCFFLWGRLTTWEKNPLNWFLLIVCFGWIWMAI